MIEYDFELVGPIKGDPSANGYGRLYGIVTILAPNKQAALTRAWALARQRDPLAWPVTITEKGKGKGNG